MQYEVPQWSQPRPASMTSQNRSAAAFDIDMMSSKPQPVKRHAACDECRKRKLKCSGEPSGCGRCIKQSLVCHYSLQKQMGRPPKKRMREDDDNLGFMNPSSNGRWPSPENSRLSSADFMPEVVPDISYASQSFSPIHPAPFNLPQTFPYRLSTDENHRHVWQSASGESPSSIPATNSPWPDFSSVSAAAPNPFTMPPGLSHSITPSDPSLSCDNQCTCLSYLYLCLSHLSSLTPFPVSQHTICSLYISARTARSILHCQICPTRFDTGMQNVMFTGTLLNVIADGWLRVSKADAAELGKQIVPPSFAAAISQSEDPSAAWKDWLRQVVRHSVVRGPADPFANPPCAADVPSVLSLIEEMEARQRRWHESPDSHPLRQQQNALAPNHPPGQDAGDCLDPRQEEELLCLRVAKSARNVIAKFEFQPCEYPDTPDSSVPCLTPDSGSS